MYNNKMPDQNVHFAVMLFCERILGSRWSYGFNTKYITPAVLVEFWRTEQNRTELNWRTRIFPHYLFALPLPPKKPYARTADCGQLHCVFSLLKMQTCSIHILNVMCFKCMKINGVLNKYTTSPIFYKMHPFGIYVRVVDNLLTLVLQVLLVCL